MVKIWNRWVRLVENFFEAKISTTKRTIQILLFYILSFSLAFLANEINRELGLVIFLLVLILSASVIITLLYSILKEIIINIGMSLKH
ncbi:MAG: hypothetical protein KAQ87_02705 [Candidatus Pacebacteria bacterium]|nr:hypothetical protein [Candidatus Paceibacterota bacterium]